MYVFEHYIDVLPCAVAVAHNTLQVLMNCNWLTVCCCWQTVSKEWAKLSSEQKLRYRGAMLQLVQQGTRDILSEAPFVKQKVS
jgi:hypothetical protein